MNAPASAATLSAPSEFRPLALNTIAPSTTHIQRLRRSRFDKQALQDLADSIKGTGGVIQPVVVRPHPQPTELIEFELVAGERRWVASGMAAFDTINAVIRDLDDEQVLELQLIENLQREGLHEMEEAEGYHELMTLKKLTADQVADKIGKSRRYVFNRLKLLDLSEPLRKAFYKGEINASIALYIARIPQADLQKQALKEITVETRWDGPMTARQALEHIQENYMLRLDTAPFSIKDITLVPAAGPCTTCPKKTGNQPELFEDVKAKDTCTDPKCFAAKRDAHTATLVATATAEGKKVITGKDAKAIAPHGSFHNLKGYIALDADCYENGGNGRAYRQILGKKVEGVELLAIERGDKVELVEVLPKKLAAPLLKAKGIGRPQAQADNKKAAEDLRVERLVRARILHETRKAKRDKGFDVEDARIIASWAWDELHHQGQQRVQAIWMHPEDGASRPVDNSVHITDMERRIGKMTGDELALLMLDIALVDDVIIDYPSEGMEQLEATAKRAGIDTKALRKEVEADARPAKKGAK